MPKAPGRPSKLTESTRGFILRCFASGLRTVDIAELIGCHPNSITHWRKQDPSFNREVQHAQRVAKTSVEAARLARRLHANDVIESPLSSAHEILHAIEEMDENGEVIEAMEERIRQMPTAKQDALLATMERTILHSDRPELLESLEALRQDLRT